MAKDKVYTQDMGQPPQEPDDASAGRKFRKGESGMPEQLGSGIMVQPDFKTTGKKPTPSSIPNSPPDAIKNLKPQKLAKGGTASARADGIAQRGKTKGKMLNKGGKV